MEELVIIGQLLSLSRKNRVRRRERLNRIERKRQWQALIYENADSALDGIVFAVLCKSL